MEQTKDAIIEEIWRIKNDIAKECGGDYAKLFQIINRETAHVKRQAPTIDLHAQKQLT
ncbi:hypothetical protein JXA32_16295 [Candidatus Sumerlaeota bacterium]|nr:hypothetical protein [Candidatus Sumerlaeota bacterium]